MRVGKPKDFSINTNLLKNRYVTDGNIWTVDETIFNEETKLFLVVSLKTRAILGYIQGSNCRDENLVIELYKKILDEHEFPAAPCFVHSDMEEAYNSERVRYFLMTQDIFISNTEGIKNQNQVSEAINNRIKYLVTEILLESTNTRGFKAFKKSIPPELSVIKSKSQRCQNKEFRKFVFNSRFFKSHRQDIIRQAILKYNKGSFSKGITRQEAQYYDSFVEGRTLENTRLVKGKDIIAQMIKNDNISSIKKVKNKISEIITQGISTEEKISQIVEIIVERQDSSTELLKQGFVGIAIQNEEKTLELKEEIQSLQEQLIKVTKALEEKNRLQRLEEERRERRRNRKRLPKRDPMTEEIYEFLIERSKKVFTDTYQGARIRIALAILIVTGVRISELLPLRINQVKNLFQNSWISIDRIKRGPSNHKAFLTRKGRAIMKKRAPDLEILFYTKDDDSYIFTPQYSKDPLCRQAFNKIVNDFLKESMEEFPNKPNIKSHSFRIGFITDLWRDTKDIEFVRQSVGHAKIDTTSRYVQNLSDEERRRRMTDIQTSDDLFYES